MKMQNTYNWHVRMYVCKYYYNHIHEHSYMYLLVQNNKNSYSPIGCFNQ